MNKAPKATVLMPVYNEEDRIEKAINSILSQTFKHFEFLIIDDNSNDRTLEIIKSYSDTRIRVKINDASLGIPRTLNKGIDLARGEYIARMDGDDISRKDRLEKQISFLEKHTNIGICGSWAKIEGNNTIRKVPKTDSEIKAHMIFDSPIIHPAAVIRKSLFQEYNQKYPRLKGVEDYGLWVNFSSVTEFHNLTEPLLTYKPSKKDSGYEKVKASNALKVREKYLLTYNFQINRDERNIYKKITNWDKDFTSTELRKTANLTNKMINHFQHIPTINNSYLKKMLSDRWLIATKGLSKLEVFLRYPRISKLLLLTKIQTFK